MSDFVEHVIASMTIEQKIGQVFTFAFNGSIPTPQVIKSVTELHAGGLRLTPWERASVSYKKPGADGTVSQRDLRAAYTGAPSLTAAQYTRILNDLQDRAMARTPAVPLHYAIDQEGGVYNDFSSGGPHFFPANMGYTAMNDPDLFYQSVHAVGRQLRAIGVHFVHSPVLDVNVNPDNPEIGTRAFSDNPTVCAEMGAIMVRAFADAGICAVAKHFPGRGRSSADAHYGIPVYDCDRAAMEAVDVLPYRVLIEKGLLKAMMTAHTIYPAFDDDLVATLSPTILTDFLRKELHFDGIITTDSMTMHGIVDRFGIGEACARAFAAGADLLLMKGPRQMQIESVRTVKEWVADGRIAESRLHESLRRVLTFKHQRGLFENPKMTPDQAEAVLRDPDIAALSRESSRKGAMILKNDNGMLPLPRGKHILLVSQLCLHAQKVNDFRLHPGQLAEYFQEHTENLTVVETGYYADEEDCDEALRHAPNADIIVCVMSYLRSLALNTGLVSRLAQSGKPVVVITNSPYMAPEFSDADAILLNFLGITAGLKVSADILFGQARPEGAWPLEDFPQMNS